MMQVLISLLITFLFLFFILRAGRRCAYGCAFHDSSCHRLVVCQIVTSESYRDDRGVNEVVSTHRLWRLVDTQAGRLLKTRQRPATELPLWQQGKLVYGFRPDRPELVAIGLDSLGVIVSYGQGDLAEDPQLAVDTEDGSLAFMDNTGALKKMDEPTRMSVPATGATLAPLPANLAESEAWSLALLPGSAYENAAGELVLAGPAGPSLGRYYRGGLIATRPPIPGNSTPRHGIVDDRIFVVHRESLAANAEYLITKIRLPDGQKDWTLTVPGALQAAFLDTDTLILVHAPHRRGVRVSAFSMADGSMQWSLKV